MKQKIAVIPGDGIGVEVTQQGLAILDHLNASAGLNIDYHVFPYNAQRWLDEGLGLSDDDIKNLQDNYHGIYFGALGDPRIPDSAHARQILLKLRFDLDLFANVRPVKLLHPGLTPLKPASGQTNQDIDCVIIRENTEDLYRGVGGAFKEGNEDEMAIDQRIHSYKGVERIIRFAFDYAVAHQRQKVTLVDKDNVIIYGGRLWTRVFHEVARNYPQIETDYMHVDVAAMRMVTAPSMFDVIVTSNMFGDILSDIGAGIVGGLGLLPSANVNPQTSGLFEPVHGSAPDIAGTNQANPMAAFMTLSMLLAHLNHHGQAAQLTQAVSRCLTEGLTTPDLGGTLNTEGVTQAILARLPA
ncbi:isocitrate/isopropylmalate dehydrogenase family protein [Alteromonas sp. a30]|uniref:isocitrate/isopropylmalate dehydrogenase family protein n=1 Tax=Alteromonas sp. a30 TaxID=2730917 RepID=UPI00228180DA|nr:isocitrate/isopropylmalate dehydrogenase family protein [Alteromonas sp. a30]MCY7296883.1 isocitrate/isopropylmalate dehydrogenase family protein [Alteromonas sp. a30]